jgi:hypothetical protein
MKQLLYLEYGEHERLAHSLARMCYPIALSMEVEQPASALKLLEASHDAHSALHDTFRRYKHEGSVERKLARARLAAKCAAAILRRCSKEKSRQPARITAALEIAERLLAGLEPVSPED